MDVKYTRGVTSYQAFILFFSEFSPQTAISYRLPRTMAQKTRYAIRTCFLGMRLTKNHILGVSDPQNLSKFSLNMEIPFETNMSNHFLTVRDRAKVVIDH